MMLDDNALSSSQQPISGLSVAPSVTTRQRTEFRAFTESAMSDGWYMLEVSGTLHTIGSNVTLRGLKPSKKEEVWVDLAQVQLGSHQSTKRLIRLTSDVEEVCIVIDDKIEFNHAPQLTLVRVTATFAKDRMTRKLNYNGSNAGNLPALKVDEESVAEGELSSLYQSYYRLMERHVSPVNYSDWLSRREEIRRDSLVLSSIDDPFQRPLAEGYEATIELSATDLSLPDDIAKFQTAGKASGLLGNPSLSVFLVNQFAVGVGLDSVCSALRLLIDNFQCEVKIIVPAGISSQSLQELALAYPSIFEIVYFDGAADCTAIDAFFMEQLSDLQVFISGETQLEFDCLLQFYSAIRANTGVGMIYSDHDCMDEFGRRVKPVFKPEWNPELLMNGNYIGSVVMLARHVLTENGGWQQRFDDSAMYDLLLRAGESLVPNAVLRIADVLWSQHILDTQANGFLSNGTRAPQVLHEFIANTRKSTTVSIDGSQSSFSIRNGQLKGTLKVDREIKGPLPSVEIIIPSKDKVDLLENCINSILRRTIYAGYQITVVDNGSEEVETLEYYAELERHPIINMLQHPGEFNYSALNNFAVNQSQADIIVLLNNDTEVITAEWLNELVSHTLHTDVGCVGAKLFYSNQRVQHGGVIVGLKGMAGHAHRFLPRDADGYCGRLKQSQDVTAVTAACLAVRRDVYQQVGGLNETDLKVAYNDVDFCLRVFEAGYRNIWTPYAELYHHESVSRGSDDTPQKKRRFQSEFDYMRQRWATESWEDSAYNPNLAKDVEDFSLPA